MQSLKDRLEEAEFHSRKHGSEDFRFQRLKIFMLFSLVVMNPMVEKEHEP